MLTYETCRPEHVALVDPQPAQRRERDFMISPTAWHVLPRITAFSGFYKGRCVGCAGIVDLPDAPGKSLVWAYLSLRAAPHMIEITKKVRRVLNAYHANTYEAFVSPEFYEGERWMKILGFTLKESRAMCLLGEWRDMNVYVRERT